MLFFALLGLVTFFICLLTVAIWKRSQNVGYLVGIVFLYYFSFQGAWFIVFDLSGGDSGLHYYYLYDRLFPINLDAHYLSALMIYALFVISVLLSLLFFSKPVANVTSKRWKLIRFSHWRIILIAIAAASASFLIFGEDLETAYAAGTSGYLQTRVEDVSSLFTFGAILNRLALVPLSMGLAVYLSGREGIFFRGTSRSWQVLFAYLIVLTTIYGYLSALGNKNELMLAFVSSFLLYVVNAPRKNWTTISTVAVVLLIAIMFIDAFRGYPLDQISEALSLETLADVATAPFTSNEMFGAHFSMYGVLYYDVPITWGTGLLSLALSIVPRVLWEDRPFGIYQYYASQLGAVEGQGYSIHHATGWYLDFGIVGVVVGAILLAFVWATLVNRFHRLARAPQLTRLFTVIAPCTFVGGIPALLRAGPEAYKGLIIDSFMIPTLVLYLACTLLPRKRTSNHDANVSIHPVGSAKESITGSAA